LTVRAPSRTFNTSASAAARRDQPGRHRHPHPPDDPIAMTGCVSSWPTTARCCATPRRLLTDHGVEVVGEASNVTELLDLIQRHEPPKS
jgi:hypothetical protein